jgi:hypothetical protein
MAVAAILVALSHLSTVLHAHGYHQAHAFFYVAVPILVVGVLGYMAIHTEHQLRSAASQPTASPQPAAPLEPPTAGVVPGQSGTVLPAATSVLPWRGGVRRHGPVSAAILAVFMSFIALCSFAVIFASYSAGARTHRTQAHGIASTATVLVVDRTRHSDSYGSISYTSKVTVRLPSGSTSIVHDPGYATVVPGQQVSVLTDPKDSTYSEFPGYPQASRDTWMVAILVTLVTGAIAARAIERLRGMLRQRRQWRATPVDTLVASG